MAPDMTLNTAQNVPPVSPGKTGQLRLPVGLVLSKTLELFVPVYYETCRSTAHLSSLLMLCFEMKMMDGTTGEETQEIA